MGLFLELLLTAFVALVFSFVIAKLVSVAVPNNSEEKNLDQKLGAREEVKLDKGLKVGRAQSKRKRVKFVDDVLVGNVVHLESSQEPVKEFHTSDGISDKVGILNKSLEADRGFDGEKVHKESEVLKTCGGKIVEECPKENITRDVKGDGVEGEKGSKDVGLLDEVIDREVVEEKRKDVVFGEFCSEKNEDMVGSGLGRLVFEEEIRNERSDQNNDIDRERLAADPEYMNQELDEEIVDERSGHTAIDADDVYESNIEMVNGNLESLVSGVEVKSEVEVEMARDDVATPQNEEYGDVRVEENNVIGTGENLSKQSEGVEGKDSRWEEKVGDSAASEDDDWEGIERSELEKVFAEAVNYVECGPKAKDERVVSLGSDVLMQLYALRKLALEGPCHEPQPMALNFSARAKW